MSLASRTAPVPAPGIAPRRGPRPGGRRAPYRFSAADAELLGLVATNTSHDDIATHFGCSVSTIERRLVALRGEIGVGTTIQVVVAAVRAGVV